jgi:RhtB (resistance to homoserine/threonine) family protein
MYWTEFLTLAIAHLFAVASPGPDFAIVVRQCVTSGTKTGLWTSVGIGSGILLHVAYCILGVAVLLSQSPILFEAMKLIAAAYLIYLGLRSIRNSFLPNAMKFEKANAVILEPRQAFVQGFLTNGLNPKATLFFMALFTVVISAETPLVIQMIYGIYLALATFAWFALLSMVLGQSAVRAFILKAGKWVERGMGVVLILIAIQIAISF